jgi:hypothetical protein
MTVFGVVLFFPANRGFQVVLCLQSLFHYLAQFQEGDAEALPCDDASFDAVVCYFGLLHIAET